MNDEQHVAAETLEAGLEEIHATPKLAPHTGCAKFKTRFGAAALAFVNSPPGRELRLRGANARIVSGGVIRAGDDVVKMGATISKPAKTGPLIH